MKGKLTVAALLAAGVRDLTAGPGAAALGDSADLDAQLLLAHALGVPRARLRSHPEEQVAPARAADYRALLARRATGEPVAYITGRRDFWSLELAVTPAVLVPRPETELLVERALALRSAGQSRVADLGTGSGAVALALAAERPRWRISATDVSAGALAVARANAARLGIATVEFLEGSWFEPLAGALFELLVSNPPYVAADDPALTSAALGHEPRLALAGGTAGLDCLRAIARAAPRHLVRGGWLVLEHGAQQGEAVRHELVLAGFSYVRSQRDLGGHERTTEGQHGQI